MFKILFVLIFFLSNTIFSNEPVYIRLESTTEDIKFDLNNESDVKRYEDSEGSAKIKLLSVYLKGLKKNGITLSDRITRVNNFIEFIDGELLKDVNGDIQKELGLLKQKAQNINEETEQIVVDALSFGVQEQSQTICSSKCKAISLFLILGLGVSLYFLIKSVQRAQNSHDGSN